MDSENLNLYFREIAYQGPKSKKDSVCGVFSYEANDIEDMSLGNIYIVGKISNIPKKQYRNSDFLLNLLVSAIKREFYSNYQRTTLGALESALQSANIYLTDFSKKGHTTWIGNLHLACLAFSKNDIHVGQTGKMIVQLFRSGTVSNISKKFETAEKLEPNKTFSNIASGKIEKGDKILIATHDLSGIMSTQKIKGLIAQHTTDALYHQIKDNLSEDSLACIILDAETRAPKEEKKSITKRSKLGSEVFGQDKPIEIKFILKDFLDLKANQVNKIMENQITIPNKITTFFLSHHIIKYIIVLFLGLIIIVSPYLVIKLNYDLKIRKINGFTQRITENIEKSELSLTYQDQSEAREFLRQAEVLMDSANSIFAELSKSAQNKISEHFQIIQNMFDKQKNSLNNVISIVETEKLADLSENTYSFNPNGILKLENILYLYELTSGFLYEIDLIDNSSKLTFLSSKDTFKLGAATNNEILLLANPEKIAVYNYNKQYNLYLLKPNLENTFNVKDMFSYDDNLFFLDTERLNIFKYSKTEDVLNGAQWIMKGPTDELTSAVSLAVDGDVFVSTDTGAVIKYSQGKKVKELKFDITPSLSRAGQIFTSEGLKNLYILDPQNSRIISFNKTDELIKQFSVPELKNLRDLWADPDEQTIYLLNGLEVHRIHI
jgi:hypothetical protein